MSLKAKHNAHGPALLITCLGAVFGILTLIVLLAGLFSA
jgi:hypothetical protein